MPLKTFTVEHSKDENFQLVLQDTSTFRAVVAEFVDFLDDKVFRHRFCQFSGRVWDWAYGPRTETARVPIDRSTADSVSWDKDFWNFLDADQ